MPPNNQANPSQMPPAVQPGAVNAANSPAAPATPGATPAAAPTGDQPKDPKAKGAKSQKVTSTQDSLLLSEVRDGMVVMADGSFRAVVACKSINFDLMSERERGGVEINYQDFLNALSFPIQIVIRSQRVDIGPYIDKLELLRRDQDNMLLGVLMDDYINFIDMLSEEANIMDKGFFVVIPYFPAGDLSNVVEQSKGFFGAIFGGGKKKDTVVKINKDTYNKAKDEIRNRVESVTRGLSQIGVRSTQLNTKQLGELYYNIYNPDTAVREPLGDFDKVATLYVRKGDGFAPTMGGQL